MENQAALENIHKISGCGRSRGSRCGQGPAEIPASPCSLFSSSSNAFDPLLQCSVYGRLEDLLGSCLLLENLDVHSSTRDPVGRRDSNQGTIHLATYSYQ